MDTGETMSTVVDAEMSQNPIKMAWGLKKSIEKDWKGWEWTVIADEEAKEKYSDYLIREVLGLSRK
jgi:hypothetical protein